MPYISHDLLIDPAGALPPKVVVKLAAAHGVANLEDAVLAARDQLESVGITTAPAVRSARTPSGGWTITFPLLARR